MKDREVLEEDLCLIAVMSLKDEIRDKVYRARKFA